MQPRMELDYEIMEADRLIETAARMTSGAYTSPAQDTLAKYMVPKRSGNINTYGEDLCRSAPRRHCSIAGSLQQ
jgi:hypothetical protein